MEPMANNINRHRTQQLIIEKKQLDYPFINDRTGETVNTTKGELFYIGGIDVLPGNHWAYYNFTKPILIDINTDELPTTYTETQLRNGTNYMLQLSGYQVDTNLYKETDRYINPFDTTNSVINYLYLNNTEMQGYDIIINYFRKNDETQAFEFKFNKESIEPEYFQKAVQLAWQKAVCQIASVPDSHYHGNALRNNVNTLLKDEIIPYTYCFQQEHRMWIGPATIIDGTTLTKTEYTSTTPPQYTIPEITQYKIKFTDKETIVKEEKIRVEK